MSSLNVEDDRRWVPTHVQVTVLRGRGLRAKGKHGTSDVYTIIQVGKEKYSTCVVEKTTTPEWKEECSFELLPGVLEPDDGDGSSYPPGSSDLVLTVMHRAVMDVFLGQAVIHLNKLFQDRICMKNEWCKLNSKTGKKEKERGDIQVTVQFTKNNLTASMYDLSLGKDKPRSTFGKIKDRIKGKKRNGKDSDEDSPSVIIGGYGPVSRMRNRLPSDGGGEEDYEDDEGGEGRRSKMRNFFLRGKLRKSSDTRSSTSLGSESSESSSRGGSLSPTAGISVVVSDLSNSPSNSSNFTADSPDHTAEFSPKLASYPCEFTDESGEITIRVPQPVCINGSRVYNIPSLPLEHVPGNPVVALVKKKLPLSQSLQNLSQQKEELPVPLPKGTAANGRRWSFDKAGKGEREAIAAALMQGQGMGEGVGSNGDSRGRKQSRTCQEDASEQASGLGPGDDPHKGWFRSKDSHNRPSQVMSSSLGPSRNPGLPLHPPSLPSWGPPVDLNPSEPLHHTNPFGQCPPPMSPSNPFLSLVQCNPFYEELLADHTLKQNSAPPPLSPCPSNTYLSATPTCSNNTDSTAPFALTQDCPTPQESTCTDVKEKSLSPKPPPETKSINTAEEEEATVKISQKPQPPHEDISLEVKSPVAQRSSDPFSPSPASSEKDDSEKSKAAWDDFEIFASGRLKAPEDLSRIWTGCKPDQTNRPLEGSGHQGAETALTMDCLKNKNVNNTLNQTTTTDVSLSPGRESVVAEETGGEEHRSIKEHTPIALNDTIRSPAPSHTESVIGRSNNTVMAVDPPQLVSGCERRLTNLDASVHLNTMETTMSTNTPCHPHSPLPLSAQCPSFDARSDMRPAFSSVKAVGCEDDSCRGTLVICPDDRNPLITMVTDCIVDDRLSSNIVASTPGLPQSLKDQPTDSTSQGQNARLSPRPPKPPRLFHLNSSSAGCSKDLGYVHTEVSNRITLSSRSVSADLQARGSDQTKKEVMIEEEGILPKEDVLPSARPRLGVDEESTGALSNALPGSCTQSSVAMNSDEMVREDISGNATLQRSLSEERPLRRSVSEGTRITSFEDLTRPFGGDPSPLNLGSQPSFQKHDSELLASSFLTPPSLTAQCNTSSSARTPPPATVRSSASIAAAPATRPFSTAQPVIGASHAAAPLETHQAASQQNSPHPVKPLTPEEKRRAERSEGRSVLDKLKSSLHPGRSSQSTEPGSESKKPLTEGAGSYYHLTHSELVALLLQREADLHRQRAEYDRQGAMLAQREAELKKMKPQVRDLEDYIDTLLVRIMEQTPTILQVGSKLK